MSRHTIGIDLGTTNCAVASAEAPEGSDRATVSIEPIEQLVNSNEVAERSLLPSFLYVPGELEFAAGSLSLPWDPAPPFVAGELARKRGAENPARLVASAKSWLSYAGADRTAAILPWGSPDGVEKISPLDASAHYLRFLRDAWNHRMACKQPELAMEHQEVLITVPASFDEAARELTLLAAERAGLGQVRLLEEPQAAFYAWIEAQGDRWRRRVKVGDLVLVCDVGGGTTDFSLILVSERDGELSLERIAVGDHILLGGDNMDLALARIVQQRLEASGQRIDTWQLRGLSHQCRLAKETLFANPEIDTHPITLLGSGSRLVGGTIATELRRDELDQVILEGFFPVTGRDEMPARQRRMGLQELGLPYAADPALSRHLARFLVRQAARDDGGTAVRRGASGMACPTHVLFNGGVMKAPALRRRIVDVLNGWLAPEGFRPIGEAEVLAGTDLEHAVAIGAAAYGQARHGRGVRIRSGAPRSYYVGIESAMPAVPGIPAPLKALCVVPFGMEEGTSVRIAGREFGLVVGEPAEFRFLSSTIRKGDAPGTLIEDWGDELEETNPLEVTLEVDGERETLMPVSLESHVNEMGTLELWCVSRDEQHRWKLQLNIREEAD